MQPLKINYISLLCDGVPDFQCKNTFENILIIKLRENCFNVIGRTC